MLKKGSSPPPRRRRSPKCPFLGRQGLRGAGRARSVLTRPQTPLNTGAGPLQPAAPLGPARCAASRPRPEGPTARRRPEPLALLGGRPLPAARPAAAYLRSRRPLLLPSGGDWSRPAVPPPPSPPSPAPPPRSRNCSSSRPSARLPRPPVWCHFRQRPTARRESGSRERARSVPTAGNALRG